MGHEDCEECFEMPDFARYISNFPNARDLSVPLDESMQEPPATRHYNISCGRQENTYGRPSTIATGATLTLHVHSGDHPLFDDIEAISFELEVLLCSPDQVYDMSELTHIVFSTSESLEPFEVSCLLKAMSCNETFLLLTSIDFNVYLNDGDITLLVETYGNVDGRAAFLSVSLSSAP